MAYLAVNKNGQEIISDYKLYRNGQYKRYCKSQSVEKCKKCCSPACRLDKSNGKRYFVSVYSTVPKVVNPIEELSFWDNFEFDADCNSIDYTVELPKGSIKKLIGKELTWQDEPFEL